MNTWHTQRAQAHIKVNLTTRFGLNFIGFTVIMSHNSGSYSSRDDQEVDMANEVKSPENQPQFSQTTMGQYWLSKTKPKQAFRSTRNAFKKLPQNFKKII